MSIDNLNKALQERLQAMAKNPPPLPVLDKMQQLAPTPAAAPAASPAATPAAPSAREAELASQLAAAQAELAKAKAATPAPAASPAAASELSDQQVTAASLLALQEEIRNERELAAIERQLPSIPDYASLKTIPDLARQVQQRISAARAAAKARGEGETQPDVAKIVSELKATKMAELKTYLQNTELAKELGLVPQSEQRQSSTGTRALTSDTTSGGSTAQKQTGDMRSLLASQLQKATRLL